jgi:hypothetical protein
MQVRAREKMQKMPNELLEGTNGERLEHQATQSAAAGDTRLETMGAFEWPAVVRR